MCLIYINTMYTIVSTCIGRKFQGIREHWIKRVREKCPNASIEIIDESYMNTVEIVNSQYAWWDVVRLKRIIEILINTGKPVIHCDMDIILEKDIGPLLDLSGDFIISTEIGGAKSFPQECSAIMGFGVCSGFYICKPSSLIFLMTLYNHMDMRAFDSYSDQVNIMKLILKNEYSVENRNVILDGVSYTNKIVLTNNISIEVLDFEIVIRDPEYSREQFGNHINIDNVGGDISFIRYFYEPLEKLPVTCRCGKLGDTSICGHRK